MTAHHPACPEHAHHHAVAGVIYIHGYVVWIDREPILCLDEIMADRLVELLNAHGLVDVPEHVPDSMTWAPPRADAMVVDWRLPEDPRQHGLGT